MRALALLLAVIAYPALAEPYRPLPRYPTERVRKRAAGNRAAQRVHSQAPAAPVAAAAPAQEDTVEPVHLVSMPPQPAPSGPASRASRPTSPAPTAVSQAPANAAPAAPPATPYDRGGALVAAAGPAAASPAPAKPADLKVTLGQVGADGGFVMLVEDPSGARIELTLDGGGRLLSVRRAGAL
jgi:hypothetical protein